MADQTPAAIRDRQCGLFLPGHQVHHIQARKASGDRGEPVELVGAEGSVLVFALHDGLAAYGNHNPRRVQVLIHEFGEAYLVQRWGVLRVGPGFLFSLAGADVVLAPCPPPPD